MKCTMLQLEDLDFTDLRVGGEQDIGFGNRDECGATLVFLGLEALRGFGGREEGLDARVEGEDEAIAGEKEDKAPGEEMRGQEKEGSGTHEY